MDDYKTLYRAGALAAVSVLPLMPVQVAVFVAFPLPTTVFEWFALFHELSAAMRRSNDFSRTGAYAGIATGVLSIVPANAGTIGLVLSIVALVPTAIWLSLVSRDLLRLSRVS